MKRVKIVGLVAVFALSLSFVLAANQLDEKELRAKARKLQVTGNRKEAYDVFAKLALNPATDAKRVAEDLSHAISCLRSLGRRNQIDSFIESVVKVHDKNWMLLQQAAWMYMNGQHWGFIISGEYHRGHHRGGGKQVNSYERDRVRALQLMQQAMENIKGEKDHRQVGGFYLRLASMFMGNRGHSQAWRLQYKTDLTQLPDYEEGYYGRYGYRGYGGSRGAPVDEKGNPIFHSRPKSWKAALSDGQRWRWALLQAVEYDHHQNTNVKTKFANFLRQQFGVQTMAHYGWYFNRNWNDDSAGKKGASGTWELHTLGEDETIAKLACGVKRFKLPDEFNFIRIYKELSYTQNLAQIFENRRQYPKAVKYWKKTRNRQNRVRQIVGNWGMFEPVMTQPSGKGATVQFRFRNGKKVEFKAYKIKLEKLLTDVKDYIKSDPKRPDWWQHRIRDIGYRLINKNQKKYIGDEAASWSLDLKPRRAHFDRRITVATKLQKAGAYLLIAKMPGGNTNKIILWVADTAIVRKPLNGRNMYFIADAVTGKPIEKANVEFFGHRREYKRGLLGKRRYITHTKNFSEFTDADGQIFLDGKQQPRNYTWVAIARTKAGRLAYLGFSGVWYRSYYDRAYNRTKTFVMTDRPVYRPSQKVNFKFWINQAKYDVEGKSAYAGRTFTVRIDNPKRQKVYTKNLKADEFGGINGEFELAKDATLGTYRVYLWRGPGGGATFRVEEYKKPEFEVKIEAPTEPVKLGEKITAKIQAKYYFGAPVTDAKVKYKILRTEHSAHWYPTCRWDWLYDTGYWWFGYDYTWYPGWSRWGCYRPWWPWWSWRPTPRPEVVAENEVKIGADGIVKIEIDTAIAKAIHGDRDHKYTITAEVVDKSRRTIVGTGSVLVARRPFKVYAWVDRGHYRIGDVVRANFQARRLDGKGVKGAGTLRLMKITYQKGKPVENEVQKWNLNSDEDGKAEIQIKASSAGQYRLSYKLTDAKKHTIEGGYVFTIWGRGADGSAFRFNNIELTPDKGDYKPGEKVRLRINTAQTGSTVLLFIRPANGVYLKPKVLRLKGKSLEQAIEVVKKDMPNFFIEAVTVSNGKVYQEVRQIVVPPEKRVLDVKVIAPKKKYKPGEKAKVKIQLIDSNGEPYSGSVVVTMYDKAVEYISGGSNVGKIKDFFWKWKRRHRPHRESSLDKGGRNHSDNGMHFLGVFGSTVADEPGPGNEWDKEGQVHGKKRLTEQSMMRSSRSGVAADVCCEAPRAARFSKGGAMKLKRETKNGDRGAPGGEAGGAAMVQPAVRTKFADTALWVAALRTGKDGFAEVSLTMPENLTTWKTKVWAMGHGTRVGEGVCELITTKNLIVRLQAPRFFTQKDEVVLSANVHNYLKTKKKVKVVLGPLTQYLKVTEGTAKRCMVEAVSGIPGVSGYYYEQTVEIPANGEKRINWRVKVMKPGQAVITMKALTDEESDAMQMTFPVYVHGMLKMESFCGVIRPKQKNAKVKIKVPAERRPAQSRLEIRYSPTLAGAMVDALPYLAAYPYGCTEQTLNRFLPTVITQKVLIRMGVDLDDIKKKRTNLNAQEIGDDRKCAKQWKRWKINPVFDKGELDRMVKLGLNRLTNMQCRDGGWGWFSGWREHSSPHTTAVVVHGLQIARSNDVAVVPGVIKRGIEWLKRYQARELQKLRNGRKAKPPRPYKSRADNLDVLVYMILVDEKIDNKPMRQFIYEDRNHLSVYAKAMFGIALHRVGDMKKRDMLIRNVEQYLVQDDENQSAWLKLPGGRWWWCWYGSEIEAHAWYLKLLAITDPKGQKASRLVKYLLNNRKHGTYWNSTRDTAYCMEAFADYIKASGEDKPDMVIEILIDGKSYKKVPINKGNLFTFDNKLVLEGEKVTTGKHTIELRKVGTGPLYFNAYLTNFTLEDHITRAGLEIKVNRKYYKLVRVDKKIKAEGSRGQAVDQKVEKYKRVELANLDTLKSGDKVEIELTIESKNDYEYIMFEDMKAAGFEPMALRSGYTRNGMGAYMELRDNRVTFFVRQLARGKHSISYRMRAEIPGKFSALPTKASAMYAPELKANSDEIKLKITD